MNSLRRSAIAGLGFGLLLGLGACRMEHKSDDEIAQQVTSRIQLDTSLAPFQLVAASQAGVVTLTGKVDTAAQREQAESLARGTGGVRDVQNRIEVASTPPSRPDVAAPPATPAPDDPGPGGDGE